MSKPGSAYVDEAIDTAVFDHGPGVLCRGDVCFSVQRNVAEGVAVEESYSPFEDGNHTSQNAEQDISNHASYTTLLTRLTSGNRAQLSDSLDDSNYQTTQADGSKAVSQSPLRSPSSRALGEVVRRKVPGAVDTRNGGVHGVLDPFRDPVHGEGDEDYQPNDLGLAAASIGIAIGVAGGRLILGVDGHQSDRVPSSESRGDHSSKEADHIHVPELLADINTRLEHQGREGNPRDPSVETKSHEQAHDEEHDSPAPVLSPEVEDGGPKCPADIQDARHPNELLREEAREPDVSEAKDDCDNQDENE